jgi:hypothetical protein
MNGQMTIFDFRRRNEMKKYIEFGFGKWRASEKFGFGFERSRYVSAGQTKLRWHWLIQFGNHYLWFVRV